MNRTELDIETVGLGRGSQTLGKDGEGNAAVVERQSRGNLQTVRRPQVDEGFGALPVSAFGEDRDHRTVDWDGARRRVEPVGVDGPSGIAAGDAPSDVEVGAELLGRASFD